MLSKVLGGVSTAAIVALIWLSSMYADALQTIGEQKAGLDAAVLANESNAAAIAALQRANRECLDNRQADQAAAATAVTRLQSLEQKLDQRVSKREVDQRRAYDTDSEYRQWHDTVVPHLVERSMRNQPDKGSNGN